MSEQTRPYENRKIDLAPPRDLEIPVLKEHIILGQEVIKVTKDKILLWLSSHEKGIGRKYGWVAPMGVFLTIIVTLVTSKFEDIGLHAATWKAIFILSCIGSLVWLLWAINVARKSKKIEDSVEELIRESVTKTSPMGGAESIDIQSPTLKPQEEKMNQ